MTDTELENIILALDRLLEALWGEREKRGNDPSYERSTADRLQGYAEADTQAGVIATRIIADPVVTAVRMAIERLGDRLHEAGGLNAMSLALDRVCALNPEQESWREGVIDRAFSGIGGWAT